MCGAPLALIPRSRYDRVKVHESRVHDIVVFGATGFTGRLVAEYIWQNGPSDLRWAIAGRDANKLERLRETVEGPAPAPSLVVADVADTARLHAMASAARVVLTTVGPYVRYGDAVVDACVAEGTDYVDITGEPEFVFGVRRRHAEEAQHKRLRIVSCCGFDTIPHDLGTFYTVQQLPSAGPISVEGFVKARGGMSGGTWNSAVDAFARLRQNRRRGQPRARMDGERRVGSTRPRLHFEPRVGGWAVPLPTIDPDIVLESARTLSEYGPDFRYGHYLRVKRLPQLAMLVAGVGVVFAGAQVGPTRRLLKRLKPSGHGPDRETRESGFFQVDLFGAGSGVHVRTRVRGGRDPGYAETSKMVSEAALCLVRDRARLPEHFGVITPAVAFRSVLIERLQRVGITFETLR